MNKSINFKDIYDEIVINKHNHEQGFHNCIPFLGMERFEKFIPGIEKSTYYLLTAGSGVGKSKLARYLFIHNPYQYITTQETDVKLTIKYFSLEESKKKIIMSEISKYLFTKYGIVVSVKELQSIGRYNTITTEILEKIEEAEEYIEQFLEVVDIIDNIRNPTGIFKYVRDYALTIGTYYDKYGNPLTPEEVQRVTLARPGDETYKKVAFYRQHDPKHFVIVLTDHISLLNPEMQGGSMLTQWQTMSKFSSEYCLHIRDKFGFIPVNVQQQASEKERIEVNFRGQTIEQKLEPSLDGLGDNKTTQRDANIVLGLFNPDRYGIVQHNGYDIQYFQNMYRSLSILKDRDGIADLRLPLFFDGAVDYFKELPRVEDREGMTKVYDYIRKLRKK